MLQFAADHRPASLFGTGHFLVLLATLFAVATWPFFGSFASGAVLFGTAAGVAMRSWHDRHPTTLAPRASLQEGRLPEINLSAIPVGGDAGGLMFVLGSMLIVMIGLPGVRWFLVSAIVCSAIAAVAIYRWRGAHPSSSQPDCSILLR